MFSRKCVCKLNISKVVRPLLAALSVNLFEGNSPTQSIIRPYMNENLNSFNIKASFTWLFKSLVGLK